MEKLPGVIAKEKEYALRVLNGEDINEVLKGAEAFRAGVEALIFQYQTAKQSQGEQEDHIEEVSVPEIPKEDPVVIATQIQDIKGDIEKLFEHKQVEWDNDEHKDGVAIYNTFMDLGKGLSEGLREGFQPKVQQYVEEIRSGKPKAYVLSGAPKSLVYAVEAELAKEEVSNTEKKLEGIEEMKTYLDALGKDHYLFTHQTDEVTAKKIYDTNFEVNPGTGVSSTLSWLGSDMVLNQIERQKTGDSHRGYKGMVLIAVPKTIIDAQPMRNKAEALESMLSESPEYGKDGNANYVIPHEYNAAYLQGDALYTKYGN